MGRERSRGKLTDGCKALKEAALFLFNLERDYSQTQVEFVYTASNKSASAVTPAIFTPNPFFLDLRNQ